MQAKGIHGGARAGAGRKPNVGPSRWHLFQIAVVMSPHELDHVKDTTTPIQRRYRLIYPWGGKDIDALNREPSKRRRTRVLTYDETGTCKPSNLRIACTGDDEKEQILQLTMPERRERLLSVPPTGDAVDSRPGRWSKR